VLKRSYLIPLRPPEGVALRERSFEDFERIMRAAVPAQAFFRWRLSALAF
jgi:hypothetical protein